MVYCREIVHRNVAWKGDGALEDMLAPLRAQLPAPVAEVLTGVPPPFIAFAHEIRLRVGVPLAVSAAGEDRFFGAPLTATLVQDCFWRLCAGAVHAHEQELMQGFVTARGGFRVGVAGTAVIKDGVVASYRDITSLCIRVMREVEGCALPLMPYIMRDNGVHSLLLCGPPGSGKTTMLRDIACSLARHYRITVIDERHELSGRQTVGCDVLKGCPKAVGILQAVRTLAPDGIVADELGDETEWTAVAQSAYCGVPLIASAHIGTPRQVKNRKGLIALLEGGGIERVAFLSSRRQALCEARIWEARDLLEDRGDRVCRVCLRGSGNHFGDPPA